MPAAFDKTKDIPFFLKTADDIVANSGTASFLSPDPLKFPIVGIASCPRGTGDFRDDISGDYTTGANGIHIKFPTARLKVHLMQHPAEHQRIRLFFAAAVGHETIHFRQDRHPAHIGEPMPVGNPAMSAAQLLADYYSQRRELEAHACQIALLLYFEPPRTAPLHPAAPAEVFATPVGARINRYLQNVAGNPAKQVFDLDLAAEVNRWLQIIE